MMNEIPSDLSGGQSVVVYEETVAEALPLEEVLTSLDNDIGRRFTAAKEARKLIEREMIGDMFRRDGKYPPDVLASLTKAGGSRAFDNITEAKCSAAEAILTEMLLCSKERVWGLEPTPIPELSRRAHEEAVDRVAAEDMDRGMNPAEDEGFMERADRLAARIEQEEKQEAKERAERMTALIEDALAEGGFRRELKRVLYDFVTHRVAGFLGPMPRVKKVTTYVRGGQVAFEDKLVLEVERISPFEIYPAALSSSAEHGDFFLRKLISDDDAAKFGLMKNLLPGRYELAMKRKGNKVYADDELDRILARMQKKQEGNEEEHTPDGIHELIYFWHDMTLREIAEGRREEYDETDVASLERIPMMGLMLNGVVITLEPNWDATGKPQVHLCSFNENPDSVFGISIAGLMKDKQSFTNIMARSCLQNAVMSAQQSYVANADRFDDFGDLFLQHPGKVYAARSPTMPDDKTPPLEALPTANYTPMFLQAREKMAAFADEATGLYPQSYGSPLQKGPAETASGYRLLLKAQTGKMKLAVVNLSQALESLIYHYWLWFMLNEGHEDCKGDMKVVTSGAIRLFIEEEDSSVLMEILNLFMSNDRLFALMAPEGLARMARRLIALRHENPADYVLDDAAVRAEIAREKQMQEEARMQQVLAEQQQAQNRENPGQNEHNMQMAAIAQEGQRQKLEIERMKAQAQIEKDMAELDIKRAKAMSEIQAAQAKQAAQTIQAAPAAPQPVI